ncbi:exodeoxyribonuclease III [bacterium AH-315-K03]|nr:exodeoxyribonuclease III [bacterium AH-315-K03]
MRVITINANGIRSAARKGFFDWLPKQGADVVCVQETRAQIDQLSDPIFHPQGYHCYYFDALKKGYSGTALYCRKKPNKIIKGLGWDLADSQGRYIQADFDGLSVISMYLPSGSSGEEAQNRKDLFLNNIMAHFKALRRKRREYIICADWNLCHKEIDLRNWRGNRKNSGFLPHERAWLDTLFDQLGYVDAFRLVNKEEHQYTWWSNRGQAWAKNVGWRLDYHVLTPGLKDKIQSASIYKEERFSDHAPLTMDYSIDSW